MKWFRKWRARRELCKQGICPVHLVQMKTVADKWKELVEGHIKDTLPVEFALTRLFPDPICDLCEIGKKQKSEEVKNKAIKELSQ